MLYSFIWDFEKIDFIFARESTKLMTGSYEFEAEGGTEQKSKQHWEYFIHQLIIKKIFK